MTSKRIELNDESFENTKQKKIHLCGQMQIKIK